VRWSRKYSAERGSQRPEDGPGEALGSGTCNSEGVLVRLEDDRGQIEGSHSRNLLKLLKIFLGSTRVSLFFRFLSAADRRSVHEIPAQFQGVARLSRLVAGGEPGQNWGQIEVHRGIPQLAAGVAPGYAPR